MTKKQTIPSFSLTIAHLPKSENNLTIQANITAEELQIINSSRLKYDLLMNGDDNCYVSAKALHEALGKPYGDSSEWLRKVIKPFIVDEESSYLEVFTESGRQKLVKYTDLNDEKTFGKKAETKKRGGRAKDIFLRIEDAQDLAMLTRTPEGAEVRKYFRTVNRVFEKCIAHKGMRDALESMSKAVAQAAGKAALLTGGQFDMIAAGKAKKRFNKLVKEIAGSRNASDADLKELSHIEELVSNLILKGHNDTAIIEMMTPPKAA